VRGEAEAMAAARPTVRVRPGIRWDRLSRVTLLCVLVALVGLYVGPARSYVSTVREAAHRRAAVTELQRERARLLARRAALQGLGAAEREARRMGMIRPGERPYIVEHLPTGR